MLPAKSKPDEVLTYPSDPGLQGLVWNLTDPKFGFEITSTVFYSPVTPGKKSKDAFMFHHGHSNCVCPKAKGDPVIVGAKCRCGAAQLPLPSPRLVRLTVDCDAGSFHGRHSQAGLQQLHAQSCGELGPRL